MYHNGFQRQEVADRKFFQKAVHRLLTLPCVLSIVNRHDKRGSLVMDKREERAIIIAAMCKIDRTETGMGCAEPIGRKPQVHRGPNRNGQM